MTEINHLIEAGAEKIVGGHLNFPQFPSGFHGHQFNFPGISWGEFPAKTPGLQALQTFCRADYVDFMEWFVARHFNVERVRLLQAPHWSILEQSIYLEADTPFGPPHTKRPWTNDQAYRAAVLNQVLTSEQEPLKGIRVDGIETFVAARCKKVLGQLAGITRSPSGVDFDSANWSLPA